MATHYFFSVDPVLWSVWVNKIVYTCALSEVPFLSSKECCGSLFLQLYIFTISVYALALTIRQLFICTEKEWQGEKDFHHTNIVKVCVTI